MNDMEDTILENSPTWPYVLAFAKRMEAKLAKNIHKGGREGWINDNPTNFLSRIDQEHSELAIAILTKKSPEEIANEAADVANFCMMISDCFLNPQKKEKT